MSSDPRDAPRLKIFLNDNPARPRPSQGTVSDRRDESAPDRRHRPHTPIVDAVFRADPNAWSRRVNTRLGSGVSFDEDDEEVESARRRASDDGTWTTRETNDKEDDDED